MCGFRSRILGRRSGDLIWPGVRRSPCWEPGECLPLRTGDLVDLCHDGFKWSMCTGCRALPTLPRITFLPREDHAYKLVLLFLIVRIQGTYIHQRNLGIGDSFEPTPTCHHSKFPSIRWNAGKHCGSPLFPVLPNSNGTLGNSRNGLGNSSMQLSQR